MLCIRREDLDRLLDAVANPLSRSLITGSSPQISSENLLVPQTFIHCSNLDGLMHYHRDKDSSGMDVVVLQKMALIISGSKNSLRSFEQ